MKAVTFNVAIGKANEINVEVDVSEKDYRILRRCVRAYNDFESDEEVGEFCECEKLSKLYQRVVDTAYDEMTVSTLDNDDYFIKEFCGGERDYDKVRAVIVDTYDICIDWPELDDDEEDD